MRSVVFFNTQNLDRSVDFYTAMFETTCWLEQPDCTILQLDNQLTEFCQQTKGDTEDTITIVTEAREEADVMDSTLDEAYAHSKKNVTQPSGMRASNCRGSLTIKNKLLVRYYVR